MLRAINLHNKAEEALKIRLIPAKEIHRVNFKEIRHIEIKFMSKITLVKLELAKSLQHLGSEDKEDIMELKTSPNQRCFLKLSSIKIRTKRKVWKVPK